MPRQPDTWYRLNELRGRNKTIPSRRRCGRCRNISAEPFKESEEILPGAKSVIVIAVRHSKAALSSKNLRVKQYREIDRIERAASKFLEDKRFEAVPVPPYFPVGMGKQGIIGDFPHRRAAVEAGLGERLGSVLTTARLKPDKKFKGRLCDREKCRRCIEACPAGAISENGWDRSKCVRFVGRYHKIPEILEALTKEVRSALRSELVWDFYQQLVMGTVQYCFECVSGAL
ncbi:MAG: Epoxyqueuosine reductase QueG [Candidatus Alkanophagales archaeon MCA70_species_1]|nr:Epoxyqueuosine reductase QueG [Candidatus Alkanophaga volatiphilum]